MNMVALNMIVINIQSHVTAILHSMKSEMIYVVAIGLYYETVLVAVIRSSTKLPLSFFLFDWFGQVSNSAYVIGLWWCCLHHHHHCLCTGPLVMLLTPVSSYVAFVLACFPHWCMSSNFGVWHIYGIRGEYLFLNIFFNNPVSKWCSLLICDGCMQLMWGLYVKCSKRHICAMWQAYLFRDNVSNVKCRYTSSCDHIYWLQWVHMSYIYIRWLSNICVWSNWHMWHICSILQSYLLLAQT